MRPSTANAIEKITSPGYVLVFSPCPSVLPRIQKHLCQKHPYAYAFSSVIIIFLQILQKTCTKIFNLGPIIRQKKIKKGIAIYVSTLMYIFLQIDTSMRFEKETSRQP